MNLLHIFMFLMFLIGFLLIITTFIVYGKINDKCTSRDLRSKLRWAIGLGTTFISIALGYAVCINNSGCNCDFGERSNFKIYSLLTFIILMSCFLLILSIGIKKNIKEDGCNIDLGNIPYILIGLSISGIVLPVIYISYILLKSIKNKNKLNLKDKNEDDDDDDDDDDENDDLVMRAAESRTVIINARRVARINKAIVKKVEELSNVRDKLEKSLERRKNPSTKDLIKENRLVNEIEKDLNYLKVIQSSSQLSSPVASQLSSPVASQSSSSSFSKPASVFTQKPSPMSLLGEYQRPSSQLFQ
jgi:hypothetical protein